jgi:hypothetical protein
MTTAILTAGPQARCKLEKVGCVNNNVEQYGRLVHGSNSGVLVYMIL